MFLLGEIEPPQAKKDLALKAKSDHKSKKKHKCKPPPSSSSEDEASNDSSDQDGDGDVELALLMRNTTKMMSRLNKKGYNYDPKNKKFCTRKSKEGGKKKCYNCRKYGDHISYD
jgi:hypothetical protein